ncbi:MAG: GspH/FimT family pseudopilin [candidate division NC10 bacterium]
MILPRGIRSGRYGGRGVTAVELITIVFLLVILGAIAIPLFTPVILNYRLRGAAWQLTGDLRLARQRAVTLRKRFRVCVTGCQITVPAGAYTIERDDGTVASPNWVSDTGAVVRLATSVTISTNATVTFSINGMAGAGTYTVSNLAGTYQVVVTSTGRVQVCKGSC